MISTDKSLLKTVRCQHDNAWIVLTMPDDVTILIEGEWHAHWVHTQLNYDALLKSSWSELLGTDAKVVNRAQAGDTLNDWIHWMKTRHANKPLPEATDDSI